MCTGPRRDPINAYVRGCEIPETIYDALELFENRFTMWEGKKRH